MNQIVNGLLTGSPTVAPRGATPKIGVWFYILTKGNPQPHNYDINALMTNANLYFSGVFDFQVCGITENNDDRFQILSLYDPMEMQILRTWANSIPEAPNVIKVFDARF
jgi:hypothetical protein